MERNPCYSGIDGYTMHVFTAVVERDICTLTPTLLAVEMDTSYTSKLPAVYVDGYPLHVHTEGFCLGGVAILLVLNHHKAGPKYQQD
jgi:hypothetical protein